VIFPSFTSAVARRPIPVVAGDEVQWGAVRELAQEEGVSIWGTGR
jgi:hypothetical protein